MNNSNLYLTKESVAAVVPERFTTEYWENGKSFRFNISKKKYLSSPVADFGCGTGPLTILTARLGYTIAGFDCIQENIDNGNRLRNDGDKVTFTNCFLDSIPCEDNTFASGMCKEVLEHIIAPDLPKVLAEIKRVLKPGAPVIFTVPRESLLKPCDREQHVTFFHSPGELARFLKQNGFKIIKKEYNRIAKRICVIAEKAQ